MKIDSEVLQQELHRRAAPERVRLFPVSMRHEASRRTVLRRRVGKTGDQFQRKPRDRDERPEILLTVRETFGGRWPGSAECLMDCLMTHRQGRHPSRMRTGEGGCKTRKDWVLASRALFQAPDTNPSQAAVPIIASGVRRVLGRPRGHPVGRGTAKELQVSHPSPTGRRIVLTAPLTEIIDHAGYFIQMSMASLAAHHEVLEDESPAGTKQLVGAGGVAPRRPRSLGLSAAEIRRPRFHLAAVHVRRRHAGAADGKAGETPHVATSGDQDAEGAAPDDQAVSATTHPARHGRHARRTGCKARRQGRQRRSPPEGRSSVSAACDFRGIGRSIYFGRAGRRSPKVGTSRAAHVSET